MTKKNKSKTTANGKQQQMTNNNKRQIMTNRVGPQVEKSSNLHITADSTGSIHKNARRKKFDPKKVRLGWGNLS